MRGPGRYRTGEVELRARLDRGLAQNEMKAKPDLPERVRLNEGLGIGWASLRVLALQVFSLQTSMFGDSSQHAGPEFFAIMEGKHEIGPRFSRERAMRAALSLLIPA